MGISGSAFGELREPLRSEMLSCFNFFSLIAFIKKKFGKEIVAMTLKYLVKYGKLVLSVLGWLHQHHLGCVPQYAGITALCDALLTPPCYLLMTSPLLRISVLFSPSPPH